MQRSILLLIVSILVMYSQTDVSGNVSGTWTTDNSPYIVTGNLLLLPEDSLIVMPGTEIRFDGNYKLDVFGMLTAVYTT